MIKNAKSLMEKSKNLAIKNNVTTMEFKLMDTMKRELNINEELKEKDQMKWVQMMNNISNCAFEMVLNKIIYSYRK